MSTAEAAPLRLNGSSVKAVVLFFTATEADDTLIAIHDWHMLDNSQEFRQQHRPKPHQGSEPLGNNVGATSRAQQQQYCQLGGQRTQKKPTEGTAFFKEWRRLFTYRKLARRQFCTMQQFLLPHLRCFCNKAAINDMMMFSGSKSETDATAFHVEEL